MEPIANLIEEYSKSITGCWLECFDWNKVKIKPMRLNIEGLITTMYSSLTNTIKISPDKDEAVWFGSLIHELYHAYQRKKMGFISYMFSKTFKRSELEAPAKQAELNATQWIGDRKIKQWKDSHAK